MSRPTEMHFQATKRALRYLKGTVNFGIMYKHGDGDKFLGFTDSDYAGDTEDNRSTSGYVFMLSSGAVYVLEFKEAIRGSSLNNRS
ncbi:unnamed protein product [Rhodiola kirilowii]